MGVSLRPRLLIVALTLGLGMALVADVEADGDLRASGRAPALRLAPDARTSLEVALRTAHAAAVRGLLAEASARLSAGSPLTPASAARLAWICRHAAAEMVGNPDGSATVTLTLSAATLASLRRGPRRLTEAR